MKLFRGLSFFALPLRLNFSSSSQSQASSTTTATTNNDNRVGVGDSGILATQGASVAVGNDMRTFDDHSAFSVATNTTDSNNITSIDSRNLSDNSSFSSSVSSVDNSVTNITTSDPEVAKAAIAAAQAAAKSSADASGAASAANADVALGALKASTDLSGQSASMLEAALNFGDSLVARSLSNNSDVTNAALGAVASATDIVAKSAESDKTFAANLVSQIVDTTKSADQQTTEKIIQAAQVLAGVAAGAFVLVKLFGKAKAA